MLIHQVTGTYLETDNFTATVNEALQTWAEDPPRMAQNQQGHLFDLIPQGDNVYLIATTQKNPQYNEKLYLEAAKDTPNLKGQAFPRLQRRDANNKLQLWYFAKAHTKHVYNGSEYDSYIPDTYKIHSSVYLGYALGIHNNAVGNNLYVTANRTYGKLPEGGYYASLSQWWRVSLPD